MHNDPSLIAYPGCRCSRVDIHLHPFALLSSLWDVISCSDMGRSRLFLGSRLQLPRFLIAWLRLRDLQRLRLCGLPKLWLCNQSFCIWFSTNSPSSALASASKLTRVESSASKIVKASASWHLSFDPCLRLFSFLFKPWLATGIVKLFDDYWSFFRGNIYRSSSTGCTTRIDGPICNLFLQTSDPFIRLKSNSATLRNHFNTNRAWQGSQALKMGHNGQGQNALSQMAKYSRDRRRK